MVELWSCPSGRPGITPRPIQAKTLGLRDNEYSAVPCVHTHDGTQARTLVGDREDTMGTVSMRIGTHSAGRTEKRISGASHLIFRFALGQATTDRPDEFRFFL